ncbi:NAD-dependent epimerase/dehydratase family protein [Polynucleobacter rarus]|uniref:NAD-dependent epimerase/dehydratase family protein n=1 Tax=Polynucleobacter rarus TaxID=556055 RepID=UPI000D3E5BAB|nr:NAD-dependent epimerase/dehydratase family protein [Polynucleobacter rarus]
MNIFISGGAGFIGSSLSRKLLSYPRVKNLVIFDNFSSGTIDHISDILTFEKIKLIKGDIKNLELLVNSMSNIDLVVHFAANPDIAKAVNQPDIDFWEGTYLTQNILEAMRLNKVKNILYTSGSGVYGEAPNTQFHESHGPLFPISTYGASKLACEALISSYCHMFGMQGRAFRFANVVGPKQTHGVGYDFIRRLKADPTSLRILGDGSQTKSYIHVEDVLNAMMLVYEHMLHAGSPLFDVFNVATDDYISVTQIADIACEVAGLNSALVGYEYTGGDRGWKGDVPKVLFNVEKIKALGWKAYRTSFEAIKDSITSMKEELEALK